MRMNRAKQLQRSVVSTDSAMNPSYKGKVITQVDLPPNLNASAMKKYRSKCKTSVKLKNIFGFVNILTPRGMAK